MLTLQVGAEAKVKHGDDVTVDLLARTPAQRRLDVLVEMAIRAATAPKDGQRPRPLFTVLVDEPTLSGRVLELANGTPITPGRLAPWLTEADLERRAARPPRAPRVASHARPLIVGPLWWPSRGGESTAPCREIRPSRWSTVEHVVNCGPHKAMWTTEIHGRWDGDDETESHGPAR